MKETRTIYRCDRCSAETQAPVSYSVHVDYQCGAVGQEPLYEDIDLCPKCAAVVLQRVGNTSGDFEEAKQFVVLSLDKTPLGRNEKP